MSDDSPNSKKTIVGIGELLWDNLPSGKVIGGAPFNVAYHAINNGLNAHIVSAIGNDPEGIEILNDVNLKGFGNEYIQIDKDQPTGQVDIQLDSHGSPTYEILEPVAWDFIAWNESLSSLAKQTDAVCFGSLAQRNKTSRQTIKRFISELPDDAIRIFDINLRLSFYNGELLQSSLKMANVLKLNDEELTILCSVIGIRGDFKKCLRQLISNYNLKLIVYTEGSKGSWLVSIEDFLFCPAPTVEVVDTVGAGDAFTGSLAAGLLNDPSDLSSIHERATNTAAFVCSSKGATPLYSNSTYDNL